MVIICYQTVTVIEKLGVLDELDGTRKGEPHGLTAVNFVLSCKHANASTFMEMNTYSSNLEALGHRNGIKPKF